MGRRAKERRKASANEGCESWVRSTRREGRLSDPLCPSLRRLTCFGRQIPLRTLNGEAVKMEPFIESKEETDRAKQTGEAAGIGCCRSHTDPRALPRGRVQRCNPMEVKGELGI
jgi:hypothetical protein